MTTFKTATHKFGIAGTSCAGKTTLAYGLVSRLKSYGVLAEGVFSQDRKFSFDKQHLITSEVAQNWMITNMISKEIEMSLHGDVDILVSDRTALDFYAYYAYQYPGSNLCAAMGEYVGEWCKTYDTIYLLPPLPFQDDGKRPSDTFRMNVNKVLTALASDIPNVRVLDRSQVLNDIMLKAKIKKPNVKSELTPSDAQTIANTIQKKVVLKNKTDRDTLSDNDMYIVTENYTDSVYLESMRTYLRGLFGPFCLIDLYLAGSTSTFDQSFKVYQPH